VVQSASPQSTGGSGTQSNASFHDLSLTKYMDSASAPLFKASCQGKPIAEALLSVMRSDGESQVEYIKYTLTDVIISNYQASGSDGTGIPVESLALNFGTFKIDYTPTVRGTGAGEGAVTAGWDVKTNKSL